MYVTVALIHVLRGCWIQISHMKKEIDAIRAKDISQGGLTQGQQTQIARNEQRITQVKNSTRLGIPIYFVTFLF